MATLFGIGKADSTLTSQTGHPSFRSFFNPDTKLGIRGLLDIKLILIDFNSTFRLDGLGRNPLLFSFARSVPLSRETKACFITFPRCEEHYLSLDEKVVSVRGYKFGKPISPEELLPLLSTYR